MMLEIELVYAQSPTNQVFYKVNVPSDCTIQDVIESSNILLEYPEILFESNNLDQQVHSLGIWYKSAKLSDKVKAGDRIEIYRPLHASAMQARHARKQEQKLSEKITKGSV